MCVCLCLLGGEVQVPFESLGEYVWRLRDCTKACDCAGRAATIVLAAAVSDFYVPPFVMPEHKIQSGGGDIELELRLHAVPKLLGALKLSAKEAGAVAGVPIEDAPWCPRASVASFKLETDPDLLLPKAAAAMRRYRTDAVVANMLATRYEQVTVLTPAAASVSSEPQMMVINAVDCGGDLEDGIAKRLLELSDGAYDSLGGAATG